MNKKTTPEEAALTTTCNTTTDQRLRLLGELRRAGNKGVTTIQARERLDIMMPGARVFELRHQHGWNIETVWTDDVNAQGNRHRIARYVLKACSSEAA